MTKRVKQNRYKKESRPAGTNRPAPGKKGLFRGAFAIFTMTLLSAGAIWLHDAVVQSPFFSVRTVDVSGLGRISRDEVMAMAELNHTVNLFALRPDHIEARLETHPWVARARVKRQLFSGLSITIQEQTPLAIVAIENLADIIINTQGVPFKEYDPDEDGLQALPVISGVDLSLSNSTYLFEGELFNSVLDLLKIEGMGQVKTIIGDEHTGVLIQAPDVYNQRTEDAAPLGTIPIKLGFDRFGEKLDKARQISRYMDAHFPSKIILAMDLFDVEKIFVKTEDALHNALEKGV